MNFWQDAFGKAYVMLHPTVTLQNSDTETLHKYINWSAKHLKRLIYSARYSAIWQQKPEAPSREVQMIADTIGKLSVLKLGQQFYPFRRQDRSKFFT